MSKTYDIVIAGGGHNGLVAACYLAKAGRSVSGRQSRTFGAGPHSTLTQRQLT